jgi:hypothetical protein
LSSISGRFSWDTPIRFALSPEEAGLLIAKIPKLQTSEFVRKASSESSQFSDIAMESAEKVFRAIPKEDGSVLFTVDFETNGMGGQEPPTSKEAVSLPFFCCWRGSSLYDSHSTIIYLFVFFYLFATDGPIGDYFDGWRIPGGQVYNRVFYSKAGRVVDNVG